MLYDMNLSHKKDIRAICAPEHMKTGDEKYVRDIHRICHSDEPARPWGWYFINPTLIVTDITMNNLIVGFTSFCVADANGAGTVFGRDVCVLPEYQGIGIAKMLHAARLTIGYIMGAKVFMGSTKDAGMAHILEKAGAHRCLPLGNQGYLYIGLIEEV